MRDEALERADARITIFDRADRRTRGRTPSVEELAGSSGRGRWVCSGFLGAGPLQNEVVDHTGEFDDDVTAESKGSQSAPLYVALTMLASTITF